MTKRTAVPGASPVLLVAVALATTLLFAAPAAAGGLDAHAAFAQLKSLEGTWTGSAAGEEGAKVEYRVTAAGSVVMETLAPGTEHEMVSMYYMDGGKLVMTHYCAAGNQPHLRLDPATGGEGEMSFVFAGGTNLDPAKDAHIHGARFHLADDGSLHAVWSSYSDGQPGHEMVFELTRAAD